ncbi:MAG: hypothetical protein V4539_16570 [Bacteroidota bacterium]
MENFLFIPMDIDPNDPPQDGPFYVIEKFPEPQFVTDEDGNIKSFETYLEAVAEADDCQDGYVLAF